MSEIIYWLQLASGLVWAVPLTMLSPGAWRVVRHKGDWLDALRSPTFLVALVQVWFIARWMIWPHSGSEMGTTELHAWAAGYVLSIISACGIIASKHYGDRAR